MLGFAIRDWSLITGRGGYKIRKSLFQNLVLTPLPQNLISPPPFVLKGGNSLRHPPPPTPLQYG